VANVKEAVVRVLLAIDGSAHSTAAVTEVAARVWPEGTLVRVLTVLHAATPLMLDPGFVIAAIHVEQTRELARQAPKMLAAVSRRIRRRSPGVAVSTSIREGVPKDVIVEEAREWGADLIVMGSHGYGFAKRLMLGSVAAAVVASAPCSVQVVRPQHTTQAAEPAA
jgi:nucleotide-binding universal stress UspA family protein